MSRHIFYNEKNKCSNLIFGILDICSNRLSSVMNISRINFNRNAL